jgi:hypothetical protein
MKRFALFILIAVLLSAAPSAYNVRAFHVTVDNTAGGVKFPTSEINYQPRIKYLQCFLRTAQISYSTADSENETVTTSVGTLMDVGTQFVFTKEQEVEIRNFRAIRTTGTSGQLDCTIGFQ